MVLLQDRTQAASLFGHWPETLIWSCLQKTMGHVYADDSEHPRSVMARIGDFGFLAGDPQEELAAYRPAEYPGPFVILVPQTHAWAAVIERVYGERARKVTRYATQKDRTGFDRKRLVEMIKQLPDAYTLESLHEAWYDRCKGIDWCRDWVALYPRYHDYRRHGLGVVIAKNGEPVAGASSYAYYRGGIEIQIDTAPPYRRRGLATVAGAALILRCLDEGRYPSWDAQNTLSLALAEKLGYRFDHAYTAYEIHL